MPTLPPYYSALMVVMTKEFSVFRYYSRAKVHVTLFTLLGFVFAGIDYRLASPCLVADVKIKAYISKKKKFHIIVLFFL